MRTISIIFVAILFISCSKEMNVIGNYETNPDKIEKFYLRLKGHHYVMGSTLQIKADSTFCMKTCGNVLLGKWHITEGNLHIKCDTSWYRLPEYQLKHPQPNKSEYIYDISNNKLSRSFFNIKGNYTEEIFSK